MPGWMRQRHERLAAPRPAEPDIILHHRVAAAKAMLVAQPLEDPLRRVPLLHRPRPIGLHDRVDHRQQRLQLGLRHRHRPRIARRQREPAHLQIRLAAQPENPRRLTPVVTLDKHEAPDSGETSTANIPGRPQREQPNQWPGFTPPSSTHRRRSIGLVCHRRAQTPIQTTGIGVIAAQTSPLSEVPLPCHNLPPVTYGGGRRRARYSARLMIGYHGSRNTDQLPTQLEVLKRTRSDH